MSKDVDAKAGLHCDSIDGERLAQLNKVLRCIRLGNFRYAHKPLNLGELSGNHFIIILRMMKGSREQINRAMTSLSDVGFINYFGMQRFGNSLISTYHVGRTYLPTAEAMSECVYQAGPV
nr:pseudouridylate synthase 7 homolog [Lytechinus pictus]